MDEKDTVNDKLNVVLNNLLDKDFCNVNNAYLEMLITHLSKPEHCSLLQSPFVLEWTKHCIAALLEDFGRIHHNVVSFMFNLCANISDNEWLVTEDPTTSAIDRITSIINDNFKKLTPSIKLGHIRILASISKSSHGMKWIKDNDSWCYLVKYCSRDQTLYVVREATSLIYDILYKCSAITYDEELCLKMLDEILKPIDLNVYEDTSLIVSVDDSDIQKDLCSTLDLLSTIFANTLTSEEKTPIAYLCEVHHKLEMNIWKLAEMTHNDSFLGKILKAQTSYNFATLVYEKWKQEKIDSLDFNHFGVNFFNTMKFCIARRGCVIFLKLSKLNHYLWKKLGSRAPTEIFIENESIQFENQLIMFHVMPLLTISTRHDLNRPEEESIFDQYVMKLFSISSEFTVRICYSFRDILLDCPDLSSHLAYKSIHGILSMKTILNKDQAVVVFQALVYALKEFAVENHSSNNVEDEKQTQTDLVFTIPQVLYATLVCLHTLVQEYNITWKESIETMCLMDIVLVILKNPNLTTLMVVQAIKLTQLSVEHFLSPHLALLVDNLRGSGLQNLGPIITNSFNSTEWEVRDSTLELVTSVVAISRLKFPAFQQYILENDICSLVFSITKSDQESYVRASGLKCLTQMIAVNMLWEKAFSKINLFEYLLWIIFNEPEGIVRKEAITCASQLYVHRRIDSSNCTTLYNTLAHCATQDFYWEAKVAALNFWEIEIFMQFTNQGMIDGKFPTVTFSRENKKIITLTETEVISRIKKVLNELSEIGCLDVILNCLDDNCDIEVVKVAVKIIKILFQKLEKYDYQKVFKEDQSSSLNTTAKNESTNIVGNHSENVKADKNQLNEKSNSMVIDEIVSTCDVQLLVNSYKNQMNVCDDEKKSLAHENLKKKVAITPKDFFVQVKHLQFDSLIDNRNNWFNCSENLSSLLDDMILSNLTSKPFHADCY